MTQRFVWMLDGQIVSCANCDMPVYRPQEHGLCPHCYHALMEDLANLLSDDKRGMNSDHETDV